MFTHSHGNSKDRLPKKDPNVVGLLQGVDQVVDDLEQEVTNLQSRLERILQRPFQSG